MDLEFHLKKKTKFKLNVVFQIKMIQTRRILPNKQPEANVKTFGNFR